MLIVNPNVCIDRTIGVGELVPGNVHRTGSAATTLGGKGVNVARVARSFGQPGTILGFLPTRDAARLRELAAGEQADLRGIEIGGAVRVATIIIETSGRVTVLNEPGVTTGSADWEALVALVPGLSTGHESLSCSGSLPPGSPPDAYARVVLAARRVGLRTVVDATGPALAGALEVGPDVVSPNLSEAEALLHGTSGEAVEPTGADVAERAAAAVAGLRARGARHAIVSAGSHGAAFDDGAAVAWCAAPVVEVVNPIGAGDSLVGGLIHALEGGRPWVDAVRFALAVASASCEDPLAGGVDVDRVAHLLAGLPAGTVVDVGLPAAVER
ncbi:MAG: 1-phosphofructokinase family hexose kinase [Acidimicrobiales bacterium]